MTAERLAYESGKAKGFVSDVEAGLALPTLETLEALAQCLEVELLDLLTFPADSVRHQVVDRLRRAGDRDLARILNELGDL